VTVSVEQSCAALAIDLIRLFHFFCGTVEHMSGFHLPVSKRVGGAVSAARNVKKTISASLDESLPVQDGVTVDNLDVAATANALSVPDTAMLSDGQQPDSIITDAKNVDVVRVAHAPASPGSALSVADTAMVSDGQQPDTIMTDAKNVDVVRVVHAPASPGSNRDRFMANCQPLQVCCDLKTVGMHNASVRFSFQAIVLIVYPSTTGPDRRHIQLIDRRGSTGITVWNDNVRLFSPDSVGQVVKFTKLSIICHNGKKSLSLGRDSTVTFLNGVSCEESKWWSALLLQPHLRIIDVHDAEDDAVINVAGIVGMLSTERKRVRDQDRDLLCIRLTDRTGFVDIRSWSHCESEFASFVEKPLLLRRVRVTSYAGTKVLELLAGPGTVLLDEFDGKDDLAKYWSE
jgi:hypothetical protein